MEWILQSRGKQLRPILVILSTSISGKNIDKEELLEVAAVIEICHTASLIHDDIIDHSDLRRGQASVQEKHDLKWQFMLVTT